MKKMNLILFLALTLNIGIFAVEEPKEKTTNSGIKVQIITNKLTKFGYPNFTVKKGIPVKWNLIAPMVELNRCNDAIIIPELKLEVKLVPGNNIIEFTPEKESNIKYSCWMGMKRAMIKVE